MTFSVTDPLAMAKTVDPTIGRLANIGYPRETLAEASGRVLLTPVGAGVELRVPVYSAPRPVSEMTQADSLQFPGGDTDEASLELTGTGILADGGTPEYDDDIYSLVAGFELQAESGRSPACSDTVFDGCSVHPEDSNADIAKVGYTSDYPLYGDAQDSQAYFAITTHGSWSTPGNKVEFDVYIDTTGDKQPEYAMYNTRLTDTDVFVSTTIDLTTGAVMDTELMNNRFGDLDSALYDSDTIIMPLWLGAFDDITESNSRINYGIATYSAVSYNAIDYVGIDPDTSEVSLSADLYNPGIVVTDDAGNSLPLDDQPGTSLTVMRNSESYAADNGLGIMMTHLHNAVGDKAQVVEVEDAPQSVSFTSTPPSPATYGDTYTATAAGDAESGNPVTITSSTTDVCTVGDETPDGFGVDFVGVGTCTLTATQAAGHGYAEGTATQSFEVIKGDDPVITAEVSSSVPQSSFGWFRRPVTVTFTCTAAAAPITSCTEPVTITSEGAAEEVVGTATAADGGSATETVSVSIDKTRPTVSITGVKQGKTYKNPKATCKATDTLSGVASCTLKATTFKVEKPSGRHVTKRAFVAVATDKAGNTRWTKVVVRLD